jgi:hypothetical protein
MDDLRYGLYFFEFKYPHHMSDIYHKVFRIEIFDFKEQKVFFGTLGDRSKFKDYCFNLIEIRSDTIPLNEENFFKLLNTYVDDVIGKNREVLFNLIDANEWLI